MLMIGSLFFPIFLNECLSSIGANNVDRPNFLRQGIYLTSILFLTSILELFFMQYCYRCVIDTSIKLNKIARKQCKFFSNNFLKDNSKHLLNLFQNDVEVVGETIPNLIEVLRSFILMLGSFILLYKLIDWGALVTFLVLFVLFPVQVLINKKLAKQQWALAECMDNLTGLLQKVNSSNLFNTDERFKLEQKILRAKSREVYLRKRNIVWESFAFFVFQGTTAFLSLATFVYLWFQGKLNDASLVFSCIAIFSLLERPFCSIGNRTKALVSCFISFKRLLSFFGANKNTNVLYFSSNKVIKSEKNTSILLERKQFKLWQIISVFYRSGGKGIRKWSVLVIISTFLSILGPWGAMFFISWLNDLPTELQGVNFYSYISLSIIGTVFLLFKNFLWLWQGLRSTHRFFIRSFLAWIKNEHRYFSNSFIINTLIRDVEHIHMVWTRSLHALLQSVVISISAFFLILVFYPLMVLNILVALVAYYILMHLYIQRFVPLREEFHKSRDLRADGLIAAFSGGKPSIEAYINWERRIYEWANDFMTMNRCSFYFNFASSLIFFFVTGFGIYAIYLSLGVKGESISVSKAGVLMIISLQCWQALNIVVKSIINIESKSHSLYRLKLLSNEL